MKKKYIVIIAVLFGLLLLSAVDKCGRSEKYKKLEQENKILKKIQKSSQEKIKNQSEEIQKTTERIRELESHVAEKNEALKNKGIRIEELEKSYDENAPQEKQITNLREQVQAWKEKFHIAENIIADKDRIIFSLTQKYEAQFAISEEWKTMYENELKLRENLESQIKVLEKQFRTVKFFSKVKTGLFTIIGGILIYQAIRD